LNVDYQQLSADDKVELKGKIQGVLAKSAGVDPAAVSATLTPGSVKVDAEIRTPDANAAKSIEKSMSTSNIAENVVEAANSIPGVKTAATGELKVTGLGAKTVLEAEAEEAKEVVVAKEAEELKEVLEKAGYSSADITDITAAVVNAKKKYDFFLST